MPTKKKSSGKKYSSGAGKKVEKVMREKKRGTLKSGGSGKKVTSRKQAVAIGLSEARKAGRSCFASGPESSPASGPQFSRDTSS
jgi:hypothetical protein